MLELVKRRGLELLVVSELEQRGLLVAFTGSGGGASVGPFSTLNLSYNVGDERSSVNSNRERVADSLGIHVDRWVLPQQVHGRSITEVTTLEIGRGARDHESGIPRTDGLVTSLEGVAIGVLTADCLPVALVAPVGTGVAVAHAGWRGVLAGVTPATARKLAGRCGSALGELMVFIGPHIGPCCMEVDEDVSELFRRSFGVAVVAPYRNGKSLIDLEQATILQLKAAGVQPKNIFGAGACTLCGQGYFSYRGWSACGRQGGFAAVLDRDGGR